MVFRAAPKREFTAYDLLRTLDFDVLAPKTTKWRRRSRFVKRYEPYDYPLFPGFLFVRIDSERQWNRIRGMPFIGRPLGLNGLPYCLPAGDVGYVRELAESHQPARPTENPFVKVGDKAKITDGPFRDHVITVQGIANRKAQALMQLFGSLKAVEIPLVHLEAA